MPPKIRAHAKTFLSIIGLIAFFILFRWNNFNIPLIRDEGEYAYSAWLLTHNIAPYLNAFMQKPPMIIYTYALAQLISPDIYWMARILAYISVALATVLIGLIARREFGEGAGLAAAWIVTPMFLLPGLRQYPANVEMFLILPLMAVLACYVFKRNEASRQHWFWAGVFSAITILYKPTAFLILTFIFIVWGIETWRSRRDPGRLFKNISAAVLGGVLTSGLTIGYFPARGAFGALWECVVSFNRHYAARQSFQYDSFSHYSWVFLQNWWALFILAAYFIVKRSKRSAFYAGLFGLAIVSTCANPHSNYYIILVPFWAFLAAGAISALAQNISSRASLSENLMRPVLVAAVLVSMVWGTAAFLLIPPARFRAAIFSGENPFSEAELVAERVSRLTSPADPVFIAGSEPEILYYARRRSPTRFVIMYPLVLDTPMALKYQKEAIKNLNDNPPEVIVLATSHLSWGREPLSSDIFNAYLRGLLKDRYALVGGFLKERGFKRWQEPLEEAKMKSCSLLLFKKI